MQCEMCGNEAPQPRRVLVDKSILRVCPSCEKFGQLVDAPGKKTPIPAGNVPMALERRKQQMVSKDMFESAQMRLELVEDFPRRIRDAREKKGWTRQDLGGRVGEREVVIGRIENGALHPTDDVAKRMEKELGIKLFQAVTQTKTQATPARAFTLGDLIKDAKKKSPP